MELSLIVQYRLIVSADELGLISKTLRGAELKPEEREKATELQRKLLEQRLAQLEARTKQAEHAVNQAASTDE